MENPDECGVDLTRCCYADLRGGTYRLAVLPWGATEPHNLHLPYLTDCLLAQSLAVDAAARLWRERRVRAVVLPPVTLGAQNPGQWDKPFCLHARYETQRAVLGDIVASLRRQGLSRLIVLNGHGGNSFRNMVRDLAFEYPDFLIAVSDSFGIVPQRDFFEERDDHAGEMETSLMMHYHPELVDIERAGDGRSEPFAVESLNDRTAWVPRDWTRVSEDTGIGNPLKSSPEKGARYAEAVVDRLVRLFADLAAPDGIYGERRPETDRF